MNFMKRTLIIITLLIALIYTVNITSMPDQVVLFKNEELNLGQVFGIVLKEEGQEILETSSNSNKIENKGKEDKSGNR